ncbi:hypothetical protein KKC74_13215 [bacterium]|nr:hypothetical protein [bacterium]
MISKASDIEDILTDYPELIRPLKEYGVDRRFPLGPVSSAVNRFGAHLKI